MRWWGCKRDATVSAERLWSARLSHSLTKASAMFWFTERPFPMYAEPHTFFERECSVCQNTFAASAGAWCLQILYK